MFLMVSDFQAALADDAQGGGDYFLLSGCECSMFTHIRIGLSGAS